MTHHPQTPPCLSAPSLLHAPPVILGYQGPRLVSLDLSAEDLSLLGPAKAPQTALKICRALDPGTYLPLEDGTPFQRRVWEALLLIPPGETRTYLQVALAIGAPHSARAVANACAANRLALLVPCHRVVPAGGGVGGYRWGADWKGALLAAEQEALAAPARLRYL